MYKPIVLLLGVLVFFVSIASYAAEQKPIPRVIIALYDSKDEEERSFAAVHNLAELPLNHLGYVVEIYDIREGLPDVAAREDVRGVLTWFLPGATMVDPKAYVDWAVNVMEHGKRYVVIDAPGFYEDEQGHATSEFIINKFYSGLGMRDTNDWVEYTYDVQYLEKDTTVVEYERGYTGFKSPYHVVRVIKNDMNVHLTARKTKDPERDSHLVVTGPRGGYVAEGYAFFYSDKQESEVKFWYINPFEFFRRAFGTDDLPKPDTTTLAGRRIYYSHIDGDGWNNFTQIESYRTTRPPLSAWVVMEYAIKKYPDLPVSVAPIGADLDPEWAAKEGSVEIAKELLMLPHVEVGTHTYSHPFFWRFFEDGDKEKERPYLYRYPDTGWLEDKSTLKMLQSYINPDMLDIDDLMMKGIEGLPVEYAVPRGFATEPFSIVKEVQGSVAKIEEILDNKKQVKVLMWSGDTTPFEEAVAQTRKAGIMNINGGDTRFDREYPSVAWVAPIGRKVGNERQIYASNSNENTYTDLWTGRFYGFKYLIRTIENTETPLRLKPFNVYYHMYSGEKEASLNALLDNLNHARTKQLVPVEASQYAKVANGFYTTKIIPIGESRYKILDRGDLQTIRFDRFVFKTLDIENSTGVVGFRHFHGSMYVYLDVDHKEPILAVKPNKEYYKGNGAAHDYLHDSRWLVWGVKRNDDGFSFNARGYGAGQMRWYVMNNGRYKVYVGDKLYKTYEVDNKVLDMVLEVDAITGVEVRVERAVSS